MVGQYLVYKSGGNVTDELTEIDMVVDNCEF